MRKAIEDGIGEPRSREAGVPVFHGELRDPQGGGAPVEIVDDLQQVADLGRGERIARFTDWIALGPTWEPLTSWWEIGALLVLGLVEFFADKIPAVNHANVVIQTVVRPVAGAVLFAARVTDIHPVVAMVAGLLVAGGVHLVKSAAVRPAVSVTTAGDVPVSIVEDTLATILSILATIAAVIAAALIAY